MNANPPHRRSFFSRLIRFIWGTISFIRTLFFNLLFLALVFVILASINPQLDNKQPDNMPLVVAPSGALVDQLSYSSPESQLFSAGRGRPQETLLRDLIDTIEFAAHDDRITGLILKLDNLNGGGVSKLDELGIAINKFKASGKPVVAISDNYTQDQYYLASFADDIWLNEMGHVALTGFGVYRNYFNDALKKLHVNYHVFKVGDYKDFVEPYTRNSMSERSKEHNKLWLSGLWNRYTEQVEKRRDLVSGQVDDLVNHMADKMANTAGNAAQLAFEMNLVDHVGSHIERKAFLLEKFGSVDDDPTIIRQISYNNYKAQALDEKSNNKANIALITAKGIILDGRQPEGTIGGETLSGLISDARSDSDIKALVLRIDSGGGSAFASELIRRELDETRKQGIPVVVSFGSVAASGGYWIAMGADEVWSTPTTITGSIGVFGLFPTFEDSLSNLGIYSDGVGTTTMAGELRIDRPLSPEAENVIQQSVESIYTRFVNLVATNRRQPKEDIHSIAGGRVWTGATAKELGLVDNLGYLDDAISSAATKANIQDIQVREIKRKLSPKEQFLRELLKEASAVSWVKNTLGFSNISILEKFDSFVTENPMLFNFKPGNAYAYCLECSAH